MADVDSMQRNEASRAGIESPVYCDSSDIEGDERERDSSPPHTESRSDGSWSKGKKVEQLKLHKTMSRYFKCCKV